MFAATGCVNVNTVKVTFFSVTIVNILFSATFVLLFFTSDRKRRHSLLPGAFDPLTCTNGRFYSTETNLFRRSSAPPGCRGDRQATNSSCSYSRPLSLLLVDSEAL